MPFCPNCGSSVTAGARFCAECGRPLAAGAGAGQPSGPIEERKVVTVLFCDLVGFTAMSEQADPEDVHRVLERYFRVARSAIESRGGRVEKFIGDAVVGVFGAPVIHEDDAVRAVGAGLAICDDAATLRAVDGSPLRLRVGINTGEALIRVDVDPLSGEPMMTGDAINTASRIQSVAPEMGVAVGEATWRASRSRVTYEALPPVTLKGKTDPVAIFRVVALAGGREGDATGAHDGVFVGREAELARLVSAFDGVRASGRSRAVLVAGEPGIGKSRLVAELRRATAERGDDEAVTWRRGRCLPYGGSTFWALREIVADHAGILEGDDSAAAASKVAAALPESPDRAWLLDRTLSLLGIGGGASTSREESFAAGRAFLASIGAGGPAVVHVDDLHWADPALLDLMADLAMRPLDAPVLLLLTSRLATHPGHPELDAALAGTTVALQPLRPAETQQLLIGLLPAGLPDTLVATIMDRAGGNPLFLEEYVHLLLDLDRLEETDGGLRLRPGAELPVPTSIHALLAARLDALPRPTKDTLADASVVGQVFWTGAVAAMRDRPADATTAALADATRLELLRPSTESSMLDEEEFAFWHVLTRDVAYAQLPRASRAARHLAAMDWIATKAGDRRVDVAHLLAHHASMALELAGATGDDELASRARPAAAEYLELAGDRAMRLDPTSALDAYARALDIVDRDTEVALRLRRKHGRAAFDAGQYDEALHQWRTVLADLEARGDEVAAADLLSEMVVPLRFTGQEWIPACEEAVRRLRRHPPGAELVQALTRYGFALQVQARTADAIAAQQEALDLAAALGLATPPRAIGWRGGSRITDGDMGGLDDLRRGIELALDQGLSRDAAILMDGLAASLWAFEGPRGALPEYERSFAFSRDRGLAGVHRSHAVALAFVRLEAGDPAGAEALLEGFGIDPAGSDRLVSAWGAPLRARVELLRGRREAALALADQIEQHGLIGEALEDSAALAEAARVHAAVGDRTRVGPLLTRALDLVDGLGPASDYVVDAVGAALEAREIALARRALDAPRTPHPTFDAAWTGASAAFAQAAGDHATAANLFEDAVRRHEALGSRIARTYAELGLARSLLALGRTAAASAALDRVIEDLDAMGIAYRRDEAEALRSTLAATR